MLLTLLLLMAPPVPVEEGGAAKRSHVGALKVDYSEVRAGPGAAYVSRGRVYRGDALKIISKTEDGGWYEIAAGALRGFVRVRDVSLRKSAPMRDAARDRRTTNYRYDEQGRRVRLEDGGRMGSGEGTEEGPQSQPVRRVEPLPVGAPLRLRAALAATRMGREFESNIAVESLLRSVSASPTGFGPELELEWSATPNFGARVLFRDARFAETTLPANEDFGFESPVTITADAQQIEVEGELSLPLEAGKAGAYGGVHVLRHAFQETQPYACFLTNTYIGLGAGGLVSLRFGDLEAGLRAGIFVPLSVSQSPTESGDASGFGYSGALQVAWALNSRWAIVGGAHLLQLDTDYAGEASHQDTLTEPPQGYDAASESVSVMGGSLGARLSL